MRPTGTHLLPARWARRLRIWSAWEQRRCDHPDDTVRMIGGDERNRGYLWQCMACGQFGKDPR